MRAHRQITERLRAQVTDFLFRGMPPDRHHAFERHLEACETCRREAASQRGLAEELGFGAPEQTPRRQAPAVPQPWKAWPPEGAGADPRMTFVAGGPEGFEPTTFPGVTVKRLFVDAARDRVTMIVRMAPGSSYPAHFHGGAEECFVIEGDLAAGPLRLRAGDYERAGRGSLHPVQATESGCVLFIVSSLRDEIVG
jgi:hypothetical protein